MAVHGAVDEFRPDLRVVPAHVLHLTRPVDRSRIRPQRDLRRRANRGARPPHVVLPGRRSALLRALPTLAGRPGGGDWLCGVDRLADVLRRSPLGLPGGRRADLHDRRLRLLTGADAVLRTAAGEPRTRRLLRRRHGHDPHHRRRLSRRASAALPRRERGHALGLPARTIRSRPRCVRGRGGRAARGRRPLRQDERRGVPLLHAAGSGRPPNLRRVQPDSRRRVAPAVSLLLGAALRRVVRCGRPRGRSEKRSPRSTRARCGDALAGAPVRRVCRVAVPWRGVAVQPHVLLQLLPRADAFLPHGGRGRADRRKGGLTTIASHRDRLRGRGPRAGRLDLPKRLRAPDGDRLPRRHVRRDVRS